MSPCREIMIITVTPRFIMEGTLKTAPGDLKLRPSGVTCGRFLLVTGRFLVDLQIYRSIDKVTVN